MDKNYISSIKLSDNTYEVKDTEARLLLNRLFSGEIIFDGGTSAIEENNTTTE